MVSREENLELIIIPSEAEINKEVFQLVSLKSPRPDGYSTCVPQNSMQDFFKNKHSPMKINKTFIVYIPKKSSQNLNDLRPISLCNAIYKIIAKVVVK